MNDNIYVNVWVFYRKWVFHGLAIWLSSRWFLYFTTLKYNTWHSYIYSPHIYVRGVFLDISKAFDKVTKVWHKELAYKLKSFGINDLPDDI